MAKQQRRRTARGAPPGRRRTAPAPRPPAARKPAASPPVVTLRFRSGGRLRSQRVTRDARIVRLAEEWTYRLRSRTRWADDDDLRRSLRARALDDLERLGVPRDFMQDMAACRHAEVELHVWDPRDEAADRIHEAAADMPWEYLISAATKDVGRYGSLLITRLLASARASADIPPPPSRVLFVESAPGRIQDAYDFESERTRIRAAVGADRRLATARPRASWSSRRPRPFPG
jgi:hypothetical protein